MANVTLPVSLQYNPGGSINKIHRASAAIVGGHAVYLDSGRKLAAARGNALATSLLAGITVNEANAADEPQYFIEDGVLTNLGAILAVGEVYCLANSAVGVLYPVGDIASGHFVSVAGVALATNQLRLQVQNSGVASGTPPTGNVTLPATLTFENGAKVATHYLSGGAIEAGRAVYLNSSNRLAEAQANAAGTAAVVGFTLAQVGAAEQPVPVLTEGVLTVSGLTAGTPYVLSAATAGTIMPAVDLASTNRVSVVGIALSATRLAVKILNSGVAYA